MWIKFVLFVLLCAPVMAEWGGYIECKVIPRKACVAKEYNGAKYECVWIHVLTPLEYVGIGADADNYYVYIQANYWNDDGFVQLAFLADEGDIKRPWFLIGTTERYTISKWRFEIQREKVFCWCSTYEPFEKVPLLYE